MTGDTKLGKQRLGLERENFTCIEPGVAQEVAKADKILVGNTQVQQEVVDQGQDLAVHKAVTGWTLNNAFGEIFVHMKA